jgi:hypothetical protein
MHRIDLYMPLYTNLRITASCDKKAFMNASYLRTRLQVLELVMLGNATKCCADPQVVGLAEPPGLLVDLLSKLASGRNNDPDGPLSLL